MLRFCISHFLKHLASATSDNFHSFKSLALPTFLLLRVSTAIFYVHPSLAILCSRKTSMALITSDTKQLDQLGCELKCPICLSLFKEAISLTCNHAFCRSCILQSLRGSSVCPVCKVHTTRREVRAAPQMDNLVSIFISMGNAACVDIMLSQSIPYIDKSGKLAASERTALSDITNHQVSGQKFKQNSKCSDSTFKGPIPAKKRVQVPEPCSTGGQFQDNRNSTNTGRGLCREEPHTNRKGSSTELGSKEHSDSSPIRTSKKRKSQDFASYKPSDESIRDVTNEKEILVNKSLEQDFNSSGPIISRGGKETGDVQRPFNQPLLSHAVKHGSAIINNGNGNGEQTVYPSFWLRDHVFKGTDVRLAQSTQTQYTAMPSFSDLNCNNGENDHDTTTKEVLSGIRASQSCSYDSDDFDWTQLPCSPEIVCSPEKMQDDVRSNLPYESVQPIDPAELVFEERNLDDSLIQDASFRFNPCAPKVDTPVQENTHVYSEGMEDGGDLCRAESGVHQLSSNYSSDYREFQKEASEQEDIIREVSDCSQENDAQPLPKALPLEEIQPFKSGSVRIKKSRRAKKFGKSRIKKHADAKGNTQSSERCRGTEDSLNSYVPMCVFCKSPNCTKITGSMMHYKRDGVPVKGSEFKIRDIHVHQHCAEWAPNVYFVKDQAKNLHAEALRGFQIKCKSCSKKGAALGCSFKRCRKSYHYPCARALSCKWDEEHFIMLCPEHRAENFPVSKMCQRRSRISISSSTTNLVNEQSALTGRSKWTSTRWTSTQSSKWVLCGSSLDAKGKTKLAAFSRVTGATLLKTWSPNVTHLIAGVDGQGAARRTMKYLMAILDGKWIVKSEWMTACLEAGNPVNEELYEITIDIHGTIGGPKQGRLLTIHKAPKLLSKLQFYFMPDFYPSYKGDLQALVMAGGGAILHRKPVFLETEKEQCTLIVYNNEDSSSVQDAVTSRKQEAENLAVSVGASVVPQQWILDSLASSVMLPK
ncbi:hypothetical protein KP509_19G066200 [Ceratopteris richardii]|uniref:Uncharacterized protein n=1 Tax=Ceratopteris richardii TaxID=49495 RepID=A0A8T2SN55_CERRI|nr:hypothetical protein KP509_19G066200 [Ceratopteris richardii]